MKKLFIEAKSEIDLTIPDEELNKIKGKVGVVTTAQHLHKIEKIVKQVKGILGGQVLGCNAQSAVKLKENVDAYLYVGTGEFHPIEIILETEKKVYCYNPSSKKIKEIDPKKIEKIQKRRKGALVKFYSSNKIGIMISIKPGQNHEERINEIIKKYPDKTFYKFISNNISLNELENFPDIECWVNTACPRIMEDETEKTIINIDLI